METKYARALISSLFNYLVLLYEKYVLPCFAAVSLSESFFILIERIQRKRKQISKSTRKSRTTTRQVRNKEKKLSTSPCCWIPCVVHVFFTAVQFFQIFSSVHYTCNGERRQTLQLCMRFTRSNDRLRRTKTLTIDEIVYKQTGASYQSVKG